MVTFHLNTPFTNMSRNDHLYFCLQAVSSVSILWLTWGQSLWENYYQIPALTNFFNWVQQEGTWVSLYRQLNISL